MKLFQIINIKYYNLKILKYEFIDNINRTKNRIL